MKKVSFFRSLVGTAFMLFLFLGTQGLSAQSLSPQAFGGITVTDKNSPANLDNVQLVSSNEAVNILNEEIQAITSAQPPTDDFEQIHNELKVMYYKHLVIDISAQGDVKTSLEDSQDELLQFYGSFPPGSLNVTPLQVYEETILLLSI